MPTKGEDGFYRWVSSIHEDFSHRIINDFREECLRDSQNSITNTFPSRRWLWCIQIVVYNNSIREPCVGIFVIWVCEKCFHAFGVDHKSYNVYTINIYTHTFLGTLACIQVRRFELKWRLLISRRNRANNSRISKIDIYGFEKRFPTYTHTAKSYILLFTFQHCLDISDSPINRHDFISICNGPARFLNPYCFYRYNGNVIS